MSERLSRKDFLIWAGLAGLGTALTCAGCNSKPPKKGIEASVEPSPSLKPNSTNIPPEPTLVKKAPTVELSPTTVPTNTFVPKPTSNLEPEIAPTSTQIFEITKVVVRPTLTSLPARKPTPKPGFSPPESTPTPKPLPWIEVDLSDQTLTYHGDEVREFIVSTGRPETPTIEGRYEVYLVFESCDMSGPGYYTKGVPNCMYYDRGYALHGAFWHNNFGHPMSHGCVNLRVEDAKWIYEHIKIGTKVWIHE